MRYQPKFSDTSLSSRRNVGKFAKFENQISFSYFGEIELFPLDVLSKLIVMVSFFFAWQNRSVNMDNGQDSIYLPRYVSIVHGPINKKGKKWNYYLWTRLNRITHVTWFKKNFIFLIILIFIRSEEVGLF